MSKGERQTPGPAPLPRETRTLLGQERAEAALLAAYRSGRLPHAWLLAGPRGIGKATLAFRFARFLLAEPERQAGGLFGPAPEPEDLSVPEDSQAARLVSVGSHPDLYTLERRGGTESEKRKSEIAVDDVREAVTMLQHSAAAGGWRVVVVDAADELNRNSANAILKALEEPPPRSVFLLVCHAPGGLIPTIRSRCRLLGLRPLSQANLLRLLDLYLPDSAQEERAGLAVLSEGSIGHALQLAEGGGLDLYREMLELLAPLPGLDGLRLHDLGDRLARDRKGEAFRTFGELLLAWIARLIERGAGLASAPEIVPGEEEIMARLLARRGLAPWPSLWENLTGHFARADSASLDRKQALLVAFGEIRRALA